jgi:hypothetical protein
MPARRYARGREPGTGTSRRRNSVAAPRCCSPNALDALNSPNAPMFGTDGGRDRRTLPGRRTN